MSDEKLEGLESNRVRLESLAMAGERVLAQLRAEIAQFSDQRATAGGVRKPTRARKSA